MKKSSAKKTIIYFILLAVLLFITNPNLYFFLSDAKKNELKSVMNGLVGDISEVSHVVSFNFVSILQLVVMVLILLLINSLAQLILSKLKFNSGRAKTLQSVLRSIFKYGAILLGFFWGLAIIGVNVTTIFASVGILALIVSFGAESLIADVITGLFMLFENQYQVGDILEVNGFRGTVTSITIRTTAVTDAGENTKIFNNSDMRNITNLSAKQSTAICDIGIPYEADLAKVREAMQEILPAICKVHEDVFKEVPNYAGVQELADSAVILRVVAPVEEKNRFKAFRVLNEELKTRLEEKGYPVPYPQMVMRKGD